MDAADALLIFGVVALGAIAVSKQKGDQSFENFMDSIGGSDVPDPSAVSEVDVPMSDTSGATTSSSGPTVSAWANAIFHFEGGKPGNLNVRNNNPGNLKYAGQPGAVGLDANGFAIFPSLDAGFAALNAQISKWINEFPSLTFTQFFAKYLGQADYLNPKPTNQGDPIAYAGYVASKLGVDPNTQIGSVPWHS